MRAKMVSRPCEAFGVFFAVLLLANLSASAQTATWTGAGADSFGMVDGDTVVTATNGCNGETITAEFSANGSPTTTPFGNVSGDGLRASMGMNLASAPGAGPNFELTFGGGFPVENLVFDIYDIDQVNDSGSAWTDRVIVTAFFGATAVNVNLACVDADTVCSHSIVSTGGTTAIVDGDFNNSTFADLNGVARTTIPGPVDRVMVAYQGLGPGSNNQFVGFSNFTFDCSSIPVTLGSLEAQQQGTLLSVDWTTATEVANVGFYVYGESKGNWERLHQQLIPSYQLDSLVPSSYSRTFHWNKTAKVQRVALAEVDLRGRERLHGPFSVGRVHGGAVSTQAIDWQAIRREAHLSQQSRQGVWSSSHRSLGVGFPVAELAVPENGIYRVTYEDLLQGGLDFGGASTADLALTMAGAPVPRRVVSGVRRGIFGPGGFVEFLGEAQESLYTRVNIYRLEVEAAQAQDFLEVRTLPGEEWLESYQEEREIEENRYYSFASPTEDPWYAQRLLAFTSPNSLHLDLPLEELAEDGKMVLAMSLWGVTDWPDNHLDHHLEIYVNGVRVADRRFDGLADASFEVDLPPGLLQQGDNELSLIQPGDTGSDFDLIHLDSYGVTYPRRFVAREDSLAFTAKGADFRIGGFSSPEVVAYARQGRRLMRWETVQTLREGDLFSASFGGRGGLESTYWVAAIPALLKPEVRPLAVSRDLLEGAADYLILSHPHFLPGLDEFAQARRDQGYRVKVVNVEDVYGVYSHGVFDPQAIRRYLDEARSRLGTRYVLLVGGDSYDYHDYLGVGSISFLPTIYAQTHPVVRFAPTDALLADGDGDEVPDVAIGRWPVRTLGELEVLVAKTLQYSPKPAAAIFVADGEDPPISFAEVSEEWIDSLPGWWSVERAFVGETGTAVARETLLENLERGVPLVSYFGHSGPMAWTFQNLFTAQDARALTNDEAPFVALQWGCWNGYHSVPGYDTLSHELLLSALGGAAAVFGASTLTEASADIALGRELFERLLVPGTTVGMAVLEAKQALARRGRGRDVVLGMTWLGDPVLVLQP